MFFADRNLEASEIFHLFSKKGVHCMGMILRSKKNKKFFLRIGDPPGTALLEIAGFTHHLHKPYLFIQYVAGSYEVIKKKFAGYNVYGWIFGYCEKDVTTNKLLKALHELGFSMSANTLREEITRDLHMGIENEESEKNEVNGYEDEDEEISQTAA